MSRPTLTEVLADATHAQEFQTFLESTFCEENLLFWRITNDYAKIEDESIRKTTALEIWEQYVCANSPNQVNITGSHYRGINEGLESAAVDLFVQANAAVFHLMNFDSFPRFLDTKFLLQKGTHLYSRFHFLSFCFLFFLFFIFIFSCNKKMCFTFFVSFRSFHIFFFWIFSFCRQFLFERVYLNFLSFFD